MLLIYYDYNYYYKCVCDFINLNYSFISDYSLDYGFNYSLGFGYNNINSL